MTGHCLKQEPPATFPKNNRSVPGTERCMVYSRLNGVDFGAVKATDYAGPECPQAAFQPLGGSRTWPHNRISIARAMTACEQIPNARETEKSTV